MLSRSSLASCSLGPALPLPLPPSVECPPFIPVNCTTKEPTREHIVDNASSLFYPDDQGVVAYTSSKHAKTHEIAYAEQRATFSDLTILDNKSAEQ